MQAVKLFIGILLNEEALFVEIKGRLEETLGPVDVESPVWDWDHTDYYEKEMGRGLKRKFLFFSKLISPESLSDIKKNTMVLEEMYTKEGRRRINLDPGYIHPAKVVLSTRKDYSHRIYLRDGVYAEVTLHYINHSFRPLSHTYPDFKSDIYIQLFNKIRRGLSVRD